MSSLFEICKPHEGLYEKLMSEAVTTIDELIGVLQDPILTPSLGLKVGQLLYLKKMLCTPIVPPRPSSGGGDLATMVEAVPMIPVDLRDSSYMRVLERVIEEDDLQALSWARFILPKVVVSPLVPGGGKRSILMSETVALTQWMASRAPTVPWPTTYEKKGYVMDWDQVVPDPRPWYCPLSGERVGESRITSAGLDYTGVQMRDLGLLAFLASDSKLTQSLGARGLLSFIKNRDSCTVSDPHLIEKLGRWDLRALENRCRWADSVFVSPAPLGVTAPPPLVMKSLPQGTTVTPQMHALFCSAFSADELRRLVRWMTPGGDELYAKLPGGPLSLNAIVYSVLDVVDAAGRLDDLIDAAKKDRPRRRSEFDAL